MTSQDQQPSKNQISIPFENISEGERKVLEILSQIHALEAKGKQICQKLHEIQIEANRKQQELDDTKKLIHLAKNQLCSEMKDFAAIVDKQNQKEQKKGFAWDTWTNPT